MKKKLNIKYRLILPIALLGIVALISNLLAVTNIKNVNDNAANIADNYMDGKSRLSQISEYGGKNPSGPDSPVRHEYT